MISEYYFLFMAGVTYQCFILLVKTKESYIHDAHIINAYKYIEISSDGWKRIKYKVVSYN